MSNGMGKKLWLIPDCELPLPGEGELLGHESVIVVNDSDADAEIDVKLFFTDKDFDGEIKWTVGAGRVRCFRTNNPADMGGLVVPFQKQYAMKLTSSENVVVQYGRLDNSQPNLAYYTTLGYCE